MMRKRRKAVAGFTLIELLVVIAIIGILAAMVFPVFARARESARKTVCLSNVKNLALAINMYLSDYNDRFPPRNSDPGWLEWLQITVRGADPELPCPSVHRGDRANPYTQWPVVLDEYVRNREVWGCPSARNINTASRIVPQYTPVWWEYVVDNFDAAPDSMRPCDTGSWYPPGWGGVITDSLVQGSASNAEGSFVRSLGTTLQVSSGKSLSAINDPTKWLVVGDNQGGLEIRTMFTAIYASACCWELPGSYYDQGPGCCAADALAFYNPDPSVRKQYAPHLGGVNLGFADGHAAWWNGEAALQAAGHCYSIMDSDGTCIDYCEPVPSTDIEGTCGDYFGW